MATVTAAPYFQTTGSITIDGDDYTAAISAAALVPTTPTETFNDIGGGVTPVAGSPAWMLQVTVAQDWATVGALAQKLITWNGLSKEVVFTPKSGGVGFTIDALMIAGQVGGNARTIPTSAVSMPCVGQPTWTPAA